MQEAVIRVNVCGTLALVDCCNARGMHATLFATGCIYEYDTDHTVGCQGSRVWWVMAGGVQLRRGCGVRVCLNVIAAWACVACVQGGM